MLKDISFELLPGETLGVIGRNGAGKSSLLKLLADIITPNTGKIHRKPHIKSQLLSLGLGFNKNLSGIDNALMALVTQGSSIRQAKTLIPIITEFSGLGDTIKEPVGTFSAGQKARLGFATAIHATPDVLLLDEILGVGDKDFKQKSAKALKDKVRSNQTVVLVSHSTQTLKKLCDRILWIENGVIKAIGEAQKILEMYETEAVPT
ncbi:ATP-binding cassette domain-containing protein [Microbulbifer sp. VAAF005]|uniref:ABC transporter ATP-binding protein n=1 Tax=Microbulbifer sp. VAAF005 TaxID=3034230 RepID=UPI0024AE33F7|nr:ATP-binding cassette domain-containing protein [Microbulbifer sp. VAAF005]WHI46645.1 ATP-binding cassette domain-containing protein [Microbulbifer sp. VAAF005]